MLVAMDGLVSASLTVSQLISWLRVYLGQQRSGSSLGYMGLGMVLTSSKPFRVSV